MPLICSSPFLDYSIRRGISFPMKAFKHLGLWRIISLIVFKNRYFWWCSAASTSLNTYSRKKSGFPTEMFPRQIEAAVLTDSSAALNREDTKSITFGILERSISLPSSPREREAGTSFPGVLILLRRSLRRLVFLDGSAWKTATLAST